MRRARYAFLARLKSFVESIRVANNVPTFTSGNDELRAQMENLFSDKRLYCESTSLAATKHTPGAALVTDDQFLFAMANAESMPTVGLTGLLSKTDLPWESLLSASKKLKDMNYGNYLPIHLYQRIVDQMLDSGSASDMASAEIQSWILSDTDGDATPYHEDVIITLYRKVVEEDWGYLNPDNYLTHVVLGILEKRNPGFIRKIISNAFRALLSTDQEADSYESLK